MFYFVWSLLLDIYNLIIYLKLNYFVGRSPTKRAKENTADKSLLCFFVFIKGWT